MESPTKPTGLTEDTGWQFGLRKTFPIVQEDLWNFIFSQEGLKIWLGELESNLELKATYRTKEGIEGRLKVFKPYSHIRMSWKKPDWKNYSTLQLRVLKSKQQAVISFHQENLLDNQQREEMKAYWNGKMQEIEQALGTFDNASQA